MEIQLDLGSPHTPLHVVVGGRLDVGNAAAFGQLMSHLQQAAGSGLTCDLSAADVVDAAGRAAVETVRRQTEEFGGAIVVGRPVPGPLATPATVPPAPTTAAPLAPTTAAPLAPTTAAPGGGDPGGPGVRGR